jgi:hypothetical protein
MPTAILAAAQANPAELPFAHMPRNLFSIKLSGSAAWQVLGNILSYADIDGTNARPKIASIVKDTGLDRATVYRAIKELEERGILQRQRRRKKGHQDANLYAIDKVAESHIGDPRRVAQHATHIRPDPFLPNPSVTTVTAFSAEQKKPGPPSRLLERVEKLLGWERGKARARALGVQWYEMAGAEHLEQVIEAGEADAVRSGYTSHEFLMNEFGEMGYLNCELAPKIGPRRPKAKPKPKPQPATPLIVEPMPTTRQLKAAAAREPARTLPDVWPTIRGKAYGYAVSRKFKPEDFNELAETFYARHRRERRSDWLLAWMPYIRRRAETSPKRNSSGNTATPTTEREVNHS